MVIVMTEVARKMQVEIVMVVIVAKSIHRIIHRVMQIQLEAPPPAMAVVNLRPQQTMLVMDMTTYAAL